MLEHVSIILIMVHPVDAYFLGSENPCHDGGFGEAPKLYSIPDNSDAFHPPPSALMREIAAFNC